MNKKTIIALLLAIIVLGGVLWLLNSTSAKNLQRQEVVIDVKDNFEK